LVALALPSGASAVGSANAGGWFAQDASKAGTSSSLRSVTFVDATHGWAVGASYEGSNVTPVILATSDGGVTWNGQDAGGAGGTNALLDSVNFVDRDHGWALGETWWGPSSYPSTPLLLATTDGGVTWDAQDLGNSSSDALLRSVTFIDANHGWVVGYQGVILATSDGGASWIVQDPGSAGVEADLASACFVDRDHGWVVGTAGPRANQSPVILATRDGGVTWNAQDAAAAEPQCGLNSVTFVDARHGWAAGSDGSNAVILATSDGGATWHAENVPHSGRPEGVVSLTFVDGTHGWAVGNSLVDWAAGITLPFILATSDGGSSWNAQDVVGAGSGANLSSIAFPDVNHGWAVGGSHDGAAHTVTPLILATTTGGVDATGPTKVSVKATYKHGQTVTVRWTAAARATAYRVWVRAKNYYRYQSNVSAKSFVLTNLPVGDYSVEVRPYNESGEGPPALASFSVVQRYYVLLANDTSADSAGGLIVHGHVALFFFTDGVGKSDTNWFFSYGSKPGNHHEEKKFAGNGTTDYVTYLTGKDYSRLVIFEVDAALCQKMVKKAHALKVADKYDFVSNNCLHQACQVLAVGDSYFALWERGLLSPTIVPNSAFVIISLDWGLPMYKLKGFKLSTIASKSMAALPRASE
jgi:photosystem II stability/assembly factor-like uncharacterized protein